MKTKICEMLGIEVPIFAFSHCRDVVIEVSKAGGFGVLGVTYQTPEDLEGELKWIDDHIGGKPYGIDVLLPGMPRADGRKDQCKCAGARDNRIPSRIFSK